MKLLYKACVLTENPNNIEKDKLIVLKDTGWKEE